MSMAKEVAEKEYICGIHEVKPKVCMENPKTRKHVKKMGCKGFYS